MIRLELHALLSIHRYHAGFHSLQLSVSVQTNDFQSFCQHSVWLGNRNRHPLSAQLRDRNPTGRIIQLDIISLEALQLTAGNRPAVSVAYDPSCLAVIADTQNIIFLASCNLCGNFRLSRKGTAADLYGYGSFLQALALAKSCC